MELPVNEEFLNQLKTFVALCNENLAIVNHPKLGFFKNFIVKLGVKVPDEEKNHENHSEGLNKEEESDTQSVESDIELDMTGVIDPDIDAPEPMGNYDLVPSEEQIEESENKRSEAISAFVEKDYDKSKKLFTEAIILNPQASLLYAKRGQVHLSLKKPNACIRDCDRAIELNPDSAAAHKFRGRANQLLGNWEQAANDLRKACKFDFDEQADEWLKEVTPNARKIEEHRRKKERRQLEREERDKLERLRRKREADAKAREEQAKRDKEQQQHSFGSASFGPGPAGGCGAGAGGCGPGAGGCGAGGAGGPDPNMFSQFLKNPDILAAFQDPEVMAAFKDVSSNPSNILKYQNNPKIMALISKISKNSGGFGGMPGMNPMGGGAAQPPPPQSKPSTYDEFNLD